MELCLRISGYDLLSLFFWSHDWFALEVKTVSDIGQFHRNFGGQLANYISERNFIITVQLTVSFIGYRSRYTPTSENVPFPSQSRKAWSSNVEEAFTSILRPFRAFFCPSTEVVFTVNAHNIPRPKYCLRSAAQVSPCGQGSHH